MWAEHCSKKLRAHLWHDDRLVILSNKVRLEEFGYTMQESAINRIQRGTGLKQVTSSDEMNLEQRQEDYRTGRNER